MFKNRTASLDDIKLVGTAKLVGYKTLSDLHDLCKIDPLDVQLDLEARGLRTLILTGDMCTMRSGALYAWDEPALTRFLLDRAATLHQSGWPLDPEAFVRRLAVDWAPEKTALYDLVADAFGDNDNPGRSDSGIEGPQARVPYFQPVL